MQRDIATKDSHCSCLRYACACVARSIPRAQTWHQVYDTPTGVFVPHIVWLHSLVKAWGMYDFARARYSSLEGNAANWKPDKSVAEVGCARSCPLHYRLVLKCSMLATATTASLAHHAAVRKDVTDAIQKAVQLQLPS